MATHALWNLLQQLKSDYEWVELSHRLNNDSPYWSGMPEGSVEIGKTVFDWGNPMLECLIQTFKFPGQFGTHIDFPGHFAKGTALSDGFGVQHMAYPLVVIDISEIITDFSPESIASRRLTCLTGRRSMCLSYALRRRLSRS